MRVSLGLRGNVRVSLGQRERVCEGQLKAYERGCACASQLARPRSFVGGSSKPARVCDDGEIIKAPRRVRVRVSLSPTRVCESSHHLVGPARVCVREGQLKAFARVMCESRSAWAACDGVCDDGQVINVNAR